MRLAKKIAKGIVVSSAMCMALMGQVYASSITDVYGEASDNNTIEISSSGIGGVADSYNNESTIAGQVINGSSILSSIINASGNTVNINETPSGSILSIVGVGAYNTSSLSSYPALTVSNNTINFSSGSVNTITLIDADLTADISNKMSNLASSSLTMAEKDLAVNNYFEKNNISINNNTVNWYSGSVAASVLAYKNADSTNYPLTGTNFNLYASSISTSKSMSGNLAGFKNYIFHIDNTVSPNDLSSPLLTVSGTANLTGANVGVTLANDTTQDWKVDDTLTLLSTSGKLTTDSSTLPNSAETLTGVYTFKLTNKDNANLMATLVGIDENKKAEALASTRKAEAFMVYDKLDIVEKAYQTTLNYQDTIINQVPTTSNPATTPIQNSGNTRANETQSDAKTNASGKIMQNVIKSSMPPVAFYDFDYSDTHTNDGEKVRGYNIVIGTAATSANILDTKTNTLTKGLFFEYGDNSFTSDDYYDTGRVYSYGTGEKMGAGILMRKKFYDNHYYDAYLRVGQLKTKYNGVADGIGPVNYDNTDMYYGAHFAYGKIFQMNPFLSMNAYGRYFFTFIPAHSAEANTNIGPYALNFDPLYLHRFRFGSKFTWDYRETKHFMTYADIAIEHQLNNSQSGDVDGMYVERSNGSETTGIFELGYEDIFGYKGNFKFRANIKGYVGTRNGLGGGINLSINF